MLLITGGVRRFNIFNCSFAGSGIISFALLTWIYTKCALSRSIAKQFLSVKTIICKPSDVELWKGVFKALYCKTVPFS